MLVLPNYIYQDFPVTVISTGAYIVSYQCVPIYHWSHVQGTFYQYSAESDYNGAYTSGMDLAHFRILDIELLSKNLDVVPEQTYLVILYIKSTVCMDKISKDANHTIHISRIMHFLNFTRENKNLWLR